MPTVRYIEVNLATLDASDFTLEYFFKAVVNFLASFD